MPLYYKYVTPRTKENKLDTMNSSANQCLLNASTLLTSFTFQCKIQLLVLHHEMSS